MHVNQMDLKKISMNLCDSQALEDCSYCVVIKVEKNLEFISANQRILPYDELLLSCQWGKKNNNLPSFPGE